jgi:hypothetical protein
VKELSEEVGKNIWAVLPTLTGEDLKKFKLHGVDIGGIWVESQLLTEAFLSNAKVQGLPKTPVFFVPYAQIRMILDSVEGTALSEKSFGV